MIFDLSEFTVGTIGHAQGLSLVLPRDNYEEAVLVAPGKPRTAIFLEGAHPFHGFTFEENDSWKGLIIPHVRIEVDISSAFSTESRHAPAGSVIRRSTYLAIAVSIGSPGGFSQLQRVPLVSELAPCEEGYSSGFLKWQIVLGDGERKRILRAVQIEGPGR
ncbi:hypothetical protein [Roseococcus sp.]|uniref:hypothetical protein n=1 Tax=Roseococcus sp. TaxID=2109646 RepID=UPI003BADB69C